MGGAFATGFLGALGDKAREAAESHKQQADAEKSKQADIYWGVIKNPDSSPEQVQYAQAQLQKLYGGSGPLKELFKKFGGLIQQTHPAHQGAPGDTVPKGEPDAIPKPPQPAAAPGAAAAPTATGTIATPAFNPNAKSAIPAPPQPPAGATPLLVPVSRQKGDPRFAEMVHAAGSQEHEFTMWKRQQDVIKQNRIEEEAAKAKATADAKAAAGPTTRPVMGPAVSVRNARSLAMQGKTYKDVDGNVIDLTELPDTMGLKMIVHGGKTYYEPFSPNSKTLTIGNETYAISPMDVEALGGGAGTDLGQHTTPSTTATTDPATGQTTVAKRTPTTSGVKTGAGGAGTSGAGTAPTTPAARPPATAPPSAKSAPRTSTSQAPPAAPSATGPSGVASLPTPKGLPPLDADQHIPKVAGSPQVVEGANQLLDGQDVNKLPAKTRDLSAAMARKYGWEQGKFTPKEQLLLREATTYIDEAANNASLSVLDEGWLDRQKIAQVVDSVDSKGMLHRAVTSLAAQNLTEDEAEFVRMYNQLVGTISGLGQLSRANRLTESGIRRLMSELPNPLTTKDSKDAKLRLARLRNEIDVAMKKGTFTGATGDTGRKSAIPAPPKPGDVPAGQLSKAAQEYLDSHGIPH